MTATKPMPAAVLQHLVDVGHVTTDGLGRTAQLRICSSCRAWVIVGLDAHRCAIRVTCDPVRLDQLGEALALLNGRPTFELWGRELERRNQFKIRGGMRKPVIASHRCGIATKPSDDILALFIRPDSTIEGKAPF